MATSVEYQTIHENREILKKAMEDDILFISSQLMIENMITSENHTALKSNAQTNHEKAESLMTWIENRIQLSPVANLATFVSILKIKREYYGKAIQVLEVALRDKSHPAASQLLQLTEHIKYLEERMKELELKHDNQQSNTGNSCWVKFIIVVWVLIGIILILVTFLPKDKATLTMMLASISTFFMWLFKSNNINIALLMLYVYCTAYFQNNYQPRGANTRT